MDKDNSIVVDNKEDLVNAIVEWRKSKPTNASIGIIGIGGTGTATTLMAHIRAALPDFDDMQICIVDESSMMPKLVEQPMVAQQSIFDGDVLNTIFITDKLKEQYIETYNKPKKFHKINKKQVNHYNENTY